VVGWVINKNITNEVDLKMSAEKTNGKFKLEGFVEGLNGEFAFREGYTKTDKHYKSLSFFVQTSKTNKIRVELFGMVRDKVKAYSSKAKKTKDVSWEARDKDHKDYKVMGTNIEVEENEKGKLVRKVLVEYDAIDYLRKNLKDGDAVRVNGDVDFQSFEDKNGEKKYSTKFPFRYIKKLTEDEAKEIDLTTDNIVGKSVFEQDIIINEVERDDDMGKLLVHVFTVKYNGDIVPATLVVNTEDLPKLAKNLEKRLNFGDLLTVYGNAVNMAVTEPSGEAESSLEDDEWGGDEELEDEFDTINSYVNELQIRSVKKGSHEPKMYNEDDLISKDEDAFNGDIDEDIDEDFDDEDDEDLPF
jgi:molybdopterin converting factor small subunit